MSDSSDADVVDIKPWLEDGSPPVAVARLGHGCRHPRWTVDPTDRTVECAVCGAAQDPIEVLVQLGRGYTRLAAWQQRAKRDVATLEGQVEALKRERRNLDAQIKRRQARMEGTDG